MSAGLKHRIDEVASAIRRTPPRAFAIIIQRYQAAVTPGSFVGPESFSRGVVAGLAAEDLHVVDASARADLAAQAPSCSTCGGVLANSVCLACYAGEIDRARAAIEGEFERARAAIAHAARTLDQEHAALASQLALAMTWGAELVEQLIEAEQDAANVREVAAVTRAEDERRLLDADLALELQRAEYGRLLEAERARSRKLELELDKVRDG